MYWVKVSLSMHTFFSDLILQKIDCSEVHSPKALLPIVVTELGIMMDFKEVHSRKAKFPIVVTEFGM